jgi:hypothetical protein
MLAEAEAIRGAFEMAFQGRADNPLRLCPEEFLDNLALTKELYGRVLRMA